MVNYILRKKNVLFPLWLETQSIYTQNHLSSSAQKNTELVLSCFFPVIYVSPKEFWRNFPVSIPEWSSLELVRELTKHLHMHYFIGFLKEPHEVKTGIILISPYSWGSRFSDVNALKAPKRPKRISQVIHFPPSPVLLHTPHWEQSVTRETASQERGHVQYRGEGF